MVRVIFAYSSGVIVAFVLGAMIGTQTVLYSVQSMGLTISWESRISATASDLLGLTTSLLPLMALALIAGWALVDWFSGRAGRYRYATTFVMTGATCILVMHLLLSLLFGVDAFAATRTPLGLVGQIFTGAVGGLCFAKVRLPKGRQ